MVTGLEHVYHIGTRCEGRDRQQSTAQRLAEYHRVRLHRVVLHCKQATCAPETRLHFVADHQHIVARAQLAHVAQIALRRHDDPALTLNRLDQERGGRRRDRAFQSARVTIGD